MAEIIINQKIAALRKNKGITQEELANHLGVTNQTVSKWELAGCCPDIQLLPEIADYFSVSIDELFGRSTGDDKSNIENKNHLTVDSVPWDNDDTIRAVVYIGKKMIEITDDLSDFCFTYEGKVRDLECHCNIECGDVQGNVNAGSDISCGNINGSANAGSDISCGNIGGEATAGSDINCGDIKGSVNAGSDLSCGNVGGDANAGSDLNCGDIDGPANAGSDINCGNISGPVSAGGDINCGDINGPVISGGDVNHS